MSSTVAGLFDSCRDGVPLRLGMAALVVGEVGGFGVLLAGFIAGQF